MNCWLYLGLGRVAGWVRPQWRAMQAIEQGVDDLRRQVAAAPEWKHVQRGTAGRGVGVASERAMLAGMLQHVERSRAASPYGRLPIYHQPA